MPLQATSGAASYDAFGGGVAAVPTYIEDVFSTWLYTGNGSTQTITNGIDLAGKGGLTWIKRRDAVRNHQLFDTARGATKILYSDLTNAQDTDATSLTSFNSNGFSLGLDGGGNANNGTYVSWTFREQPKFFDVVTYTGNDAASRQIAHNLGSTPGCVIVKATNNTLDWFVSHRSLATANAYLNLNTTAASATGQNWGNSGGTRPTSTDFTVGDNTNISGYTYVAYLFAHNAGGFGLTGTDNVISCGSFTSTGSGTITVDLGYEPQWILMKASTSSGLDWFMFDNMRGTPVGSGPQLLYANSSGSENTGNPSAFQPTATGFTAQGSYWGSNTLIYIAIRRGPMRTPTTGTSVFKPISSSSSTGTTQTTDFPVDMQWLRSRGADATYVIDRLRGISTTPITASSKTLYTNDTFAESGTNTSNGWNNTGFSIPSQQGGTSSIYWTFRRAPGFFDEVCYTGTGASNSARTHNLGVPPEILIIKNRSAQGSGDWYTFHTFTSSNFQRQLLSTTDAQTNTTYGSFLDAQPTSTTFTVNSGTGCNNSGTTYVAYLFASCPGVSKVFNYTGNGSSQTINCGFTGGARFVMIKRTDSTGDWYVWDTARGIVANNDPHLSLNTTAAEVTTNDTIDTDSTGFVVNQVSATNVNVNGASYIGLAIA